MAYAIVTLDTKEGAESHLNHLYDHLDLIPLESDDSNLQLRVDLCHVIGGWIDNSPIIPDWEELQKMYMNISWVIDKGPFEQRRRMIYEIMRGMITWMSGFWIAKRIYRERPIIKERELKQNINWTYALDNDLGIYDREVECHLVITRAEYTGDPDEEEGWQSDWRSMRG